jgi:REP element-mobilizing transposase RayT
LGDIFARRPVFFVTFCSAGRQPILHRNSIQRGFVAFGENAAEAGAYVGRYVIMPDHVHLFVALFPGSTSLSLWIKSLKNTLSKILRHESLPAPHWQKGFFDHVLRSHDSYDQKWDYVAENPVRAGLVQTRTDWPFQGTIWDLTLSQPRRS